jgi:hypothetical protein
VDTQLCAALLCRVCQEALVKQSVFIASEPSAAFEARRSRTVNFPSSESSETRSRRPSIVTQVSSVMDVSRWGVESYEPGGQDPVAWLIDPDGTRWLLSRLSSGRTGGRERTGREDRGGTSHAGQLPAARIELATRMTEPGCISNDLRPGAQWEMQRARS